MENKENIIIDHEEEVKYISEKTGIDEETIYKIFDADYDFLIEKGVIIVEEIEDWQI